MKRLAFKMKLFTGFEAEYEKRHAAIWPELSALLKDQGIAAYSIFLDRETNILFATMKMTDPANLDLLAAQPVMAQWWAHMKDIMETHPDHSPVSVPLQDGVLFAIGNKMQNKKCSMQEKQLLHAAFNISAYPIDSSTSGVTPVKLNPPSWNKFCMVT